MTEEKSDWEYKEPAPKGELVEVELSFNKVWAQVAQTEGLIGYRTRAKRVKVNTYRIDKFRTKDGDIVTLEFDAKNVIRWRPIPNV